MTPEDTRLAQDLAVALARVEGKIDAYAARTSAVEETLREHDERIRSTASLEEHVALEVRVRAQEMKPVVTPSGLVAALVATVAVLGGFVTFLDRLTGAN